LALYQALRLIEKEENKGGLLTDHVAATSVGIIDKELFLDLNYIEDSQAEVDMNIVMTGDGNLVEVQGTAEGRPFSQKEMDALLDLAQKGIKELISIQREVIEGV
jgi:ribonuclease PH